MAKSVFQLSKELKDKKEEAYRKYRLKTVKKVEEPAEEEDVVDLEEEVSKYHTGGGYYQIGDEKVRGKDAAMDLLKK